MKEDPEEIIPILLPPDLKNRDELVGLYSSALDTLDLAAADYLTIGDITDLSGCHDTALHALLIAMFDMLDRGGLCLALDRQSLHDKLSRFVRDAEIMARRIEQKIDSWGDVICFIDGRDERPSSPPEFKPLVCLRDSRRLYFQKYYIHEGRVIAGLQRFMSSPPAAPPGAGAITADLYHVLIQSPLRFRGEAAIANTAQTLAIILPLMGNFTIVSGGPGTGKTSIVLNILRLFSRRGVGPSRMVIAAPTGRAAMRLTESIRKGLRSIEQPDSRDSALSDMEAVTIHRLLQFSPMKNSFAYNREQTLPADLIIIDEASMIDITLLGALLDAVNQGATMVLLGDKNQLPSVEAGAVLADLMPDGVMARYSATALSLLDEVCQGAAARYGALADRDDAARVDRFVMLDQSYRSGKDILEIAHRIIADPLDLAAYIPPIHSSALAATGIFRIDPLESGNSLEAVLARWASLNFLDTAGGPSFRDLARMAARYSPEHLADEEFRSVIQGLFAFIDRSRIISPTRRGPWGIEAVNRRMGAIMSRDLSQAALYGPSDLAEPVIMTRNDYSRDLFNGDVGIALTASDGARHVFFSGLQGFRCFPVHALSGLEAAWAITVHKSQGSEYDRVLLLMSEKNDRLLTREILYTAITRARDLAVMYADAPTINRAAASRMERESGISLPSPC